MALRPFQELWDKRPNSMTKDILTVLIVQEIPRMWGLYEPETVEEDPIDIRNIFWSLE